METPGQGSSAAAPVRIPLCALRVEGAIDRLWVDAVPRHRSAGPPIYALREALGLELFVAQESSSSAAAAAGGGAELMSADPTATAPGAEWASVHMSKLQRKLARSLVYVEAEQQALMITDL
jgi:hypothetical protein